MTKAQYEARITELEEEVHKLKKLLPELERQVEPLNPVWKPETNDAFYTIFNDGTISSYRWTGDFEDEFMLQTANIFRTKADAEFALERRKVLSEMDQWRGELYDPYAIGLFNNTTGDLEVIIFNRYSMASFGEYRFSGWDYAKACIDSVGEDRLIKYYFRYGEKS